MMSDFNVDNVVPILLQDGALLRSRDKLARGLNIPEHQLIQWNDQYRSDTITMEEFFRRMLTQWKSQMGVEATTTSLSNMLRKNNFNATADVLLTFLTVISTTGTSTMSTVPSPINNFVGRINELDHLLQLFKENHHLSVVISAIGGQGKTELCRKFVQQHTKDKNLVITWLSGDSAQTFVQSLLSYASTINLSLNKLEPLATLIDNVVVQLKHNSKWLVVIDNVESSYEELTLAVQAFLRHNSFVLVTSRRSDILTDSEHIELQPLEDADAVEFVEKALNHKNDVVEFCKLVGNHPLALQQAVAYIKHQNRVVDFEYSISDYLKDLSWGIVEGLDYQAQSFEYKTTTLEIINSLLKQIRLTDEKEGAKTFTLLHVLTLFDGTAIALNFLKHLFSKVESEFVFKKSVQVLKKLSLVKVDNNALFIHRLFQLVSFYCFRKEESHTWAEVIHKLLTDLEKEMNNMSEENIRQVVKIWSNASGIFGVLDYEAQSFKYKKTNVLEQIRDIDKKEGAKALSLLHVLSLVDSAGIGLDFLKYLFSKLEYESVFEKSVQVLKKMSLVKEVHDNVLVTHKLFQVVSLHCFKRRGKQKWAEVVEKLLLVLGFERTYPMHSASKEDVRQIVSIWSNAASIVELVQLYSHVPNIIFYRLHNLSLYRESMHFAENVSKIFLEILGKDHENTLKIESCLAIALRTNNEYEESFIKSRIVWEKEKKIFGKRCNWMYSSPGYNIIRALSHLDEHSGSLKWSQLFLKSGKIYLEQKHKDKLNQIHSNYLEAGPDTHFAYKEKLALQEKTLGHEHPETLITRFFNALYTYERGDLLEAKKELEQVLKSRVKVLGEEHADTLDTKFWLAVTLHLLAEKKAVLELLEEILIDEENRGSSCTEETKERIKHYTRLLNRGWDFLPSFMTSK